MSYKALLLIFVLNYSILEAKNYTQLDFELAEDSVASLLKESKNINTTLDSIFNLDDNLYKGIASLKIGRNKMRTQRNGEAEKFIEIAKECFSRVKYIKGIGYCNFYLGSIFSNREDDEKLVLYYHKAINYFLDCGFYDGIITTHLKLATFYSRENISELAKDHFKKGSTFFKNSTNDKLKSTFLLNNAAHYSDIEEADSALVLYEIIESQYANQLTSTKFSRLYNNIALNLTLLGKLEDAKKYYNKSLVIKEQLKDSLGLINTKLNLFYLYVKEKNINKSKVYYSELKILFQDTTNLNNTYLDFLDNEIDYHLLIQSYDTIALLLNNFRIKSENLSKNSFSDKLVEMQKSFEIQERDKNIALLQKEHELKEARLSNQFIVIISIGAVLLLLIVLGYFINKQRVKLKRSESHLKKQQKRIKQINSDLKTSNLAKDRILSIIGHDLRGPIGGLKELIELYMDMPGYEEEDFKSLLKAAREVSTGSYYLLENLLTWANSQNGQIDFKPVTAPLLPLAKNSIDLLDSSINTRNVSFKYDISPDIKLTADLNMLRTIIRNLLSNAVKYSPPESCITISATQNNEETFICIADQGYGMTAEQSSALFEKKETYFIEAGYNAKGSGLGLVLCREFVEQHKGKIWADSIPNKGTKVCFTISANIDLPKTTSALHEHTPVMN